MPTSRRRRGKNPTELSLVWDPDLQYEEMIDPGRAMEMVERAKRAWGSTIHPPHGYYLMDDVDGRPMFITTSRVNRPFTISLGGEKAKLVPVYGEPGVLVCKAADDRSARLIKEHMRPIGLGSLDDETALVVSRALNEANLVSVEPTPDKLKLSTSDSDVMRHGYCGSLVLGESGAIGGGDEWFCGVAPGIPYLLRSIAGARRKEGIRVGRGRDWLRSKFPGMTDAQLEYISKHYLGIGGSDLDYLTSEELERLTPLLERVGPVRRVMGTELFTNWGWIDLLNRIKSIPGIDEEKAVLLREYALEALQDELYGLSVEETKRRIVEWISRNLQS